MASDPELVEYRHLVARACRILAHEGLVDTVLGHVSYRVDDLRMLIRCRGPHERGLIFTVPDDIRLVDLDGDWAEPPEGYSVPNELPIHGEVLRQRPELKSVVHGHPPAVVACGIMEIPLRPIFGAFNIPALRMALAGVPVYPRSVLIRRPDLAREMVAAMQDKPYCLLKGHGMTVGAPSVEQAVVAALNLNALAVMNLEVTRTGRPAADVPPQDLAELPDLGSAFNDQSVWRYYAARAERAGW